MGIKDIDFLEKTDNIIYTSSVSGAGIPELENKIVEKVGLSDFEDDIYVNLRQQTLIENALNGIDKIFKDIDFLIENKEILMLYIQEVEKELDEIVGYITTEDILGNIFSKFCIGK